MPFTDPGRRRSHMRSDENVRHSPKRVIGRKWLDLADIQRRAGDAILFQCHCEVSQVNDGSPSDIDEVTVRSHLLQHFATKHPLGAGCMRSGDHDEMTLSQERIEIDQRAHLANPFDRSRVRVDSENSHPEGPGPATDLLSNCTNTDDAERTVRQMSVGPVDGADDAWTLREVWKSRTAADRLPASFTLLIAVQVQVSRKCQNVPQNVIRDDIRENASHVGQHARVFNQLWKDVMLEAGGGRLNPSELS